MLMAPPVLRGANQGGCTLDTSPQGQGAPHWNELVRVGRGCRQLPGRQSQDQPTLTQLSHPYGQDKSRSPGPFLGARAVCSQHSPPDYLGPRCPKLQRV